MNQIQIKFYYIIYILIYILINIIFKNYKVEKNDEKK